LIKDRNTKQKDREAKEAAKTETKEPETKKQKQENREREKPRGQARAHGLQERAGGAKRAQVKERKHKSETDELQIHGQ
jgi:hypothetical protein